VPVRRGERDPRDNLGGATASRADQRTRLVDLDLTLKAIRRSSCVAAEILGETRRRTMRVGGAETDSDTFVVAIARLTR